VTFPTMTPPNVVVIVPGWALLDSTQRTQAIAPGFQVLALAHADSGKWCLPGGGIDRTESPEEAARRELLEETGFRALRLRFLVDAGVARYFYAEIVEGRLRSSFEGRPAWVMPQLVSDPHTGRFPLTDGQALEVLRKELCIR